MKNKNIELDIVLFNLLAKENPTKSRKNSHRPILSNGMNPKPYKDYFTMVWKGFPENIYQEINQALSNVLVFSNNFDNRIIEVELENEKVVNLKIIN